MEFSGLPPELIEVIQVARRRHTGKGTDRAANLLEEEIEKVRAYLNVLQAELRLVHRQATDHVPGVKAPSIRDLQDELTRALREKDNWSLIINAPVNTSTWAIRKEAERVVAELDARIAVIEARLRDKANNPDNIEICPSQKPVTKRKGHTG